MIASASDVAARSERPLPNLWLHPVLGLAAIVLFVGSFLAWATLAPLASSAQAAGIVKTMGNRRIVQNLEGGVIRQILVQEGSLVKSGELLLRLHDEQSSAAMDLLGATLDAQRALRARLEAEVRGWPAVVFPESLLARAGDPRIAEILAGQRAIFTQRARSIENQRNILQQRIRQAEAEILSYQALVDSFERQLEIIRQEEAVVADLVKRGYERMPRLHALRRQATQLDGNREQQRSLIARARQAISESELQSRQILEAMQRDATIELRDTDTRIVEAEERLRVANDVQFRRDVVAPADGVVMNLRFTTIGGVVRPGEAILEIVPSQEQLIIEVNVDAQNHGDVKIGGRAEVLMTSFKLRNAPALHGHVVHVSPDATPGATPGRNYYRAHVEFDPESLRRFQARMGMAVAPGMPAEVLIDAGERTFLQYLLEPLWRSWRRAFTET